MLVQPQQAATVCEFDLVQHAIRLWQQAQPWIRINGQSTAHEPLNLTLDVEQLSFVSPNGLAEAVPLPSLTGTASKRQTSSRPSVEHLERKNEESMPYSSLNAWAVDLGAFPVPRGIFRQNQR
jgi:hypothetical protein